MSADAIYQVTEALSASLKNALVLAGDAGTVFIGPLDDPGAGDAALILFLYRIAPNPSLRNSAHRVAPERPDLPPLVYEHALPLDLYYLVTVGTRPGSEALLLRTLGLALRALNDDPLLTGPAVGQEVVRVSLEPLSTEEISRVWALFPTVNYRTSVAYYVAPVWIDPPTLPTPQPAVRHDLPRAGHLRGAPGAGAPP